MTEHINLNNDWRYSGAFQPEMTDSAYDDSSMDTVRLPHTNIETPYNYFDDGIYQFVSCYRRKLKVKKDWEGKQILLTFEGVAHIATVYINGIMVITHNGGYTAFSADIAAYLDFWGENLLTVEVDSRESNNLPPFGNVIDYMTYGGIYREVYLDIREQQSIEDAFVMTRDISTENTSTENTSTENTYITGNSPEPEILNERKRAGDKNKTGDKNRTDDKYIGCDKNKEVTLEVTLHEVNNDSKLRLTYLITDSSDKTVYSDTIPVTGEVIRHSFVVKGVTDWDINHPVLYYLKLELTGGEKNNRKLDERLIRFGFRTCDFKEDGFYLNHKKIKLIGLNRHQSYPYVGYAMPKRMQQLDADILKEELGVNAVRTSHYPQSMHFIDRCDELGLLVFTEIPGWQHIGDEEWKRIACENVREMVLQYRNHPSIILWGVRINESQDDDDLYRKTNQIAHELDPSRQTGGVRYLKKSHLLEDVYTYNDFLHNGRTKGLDRVEEVTSDRKAPYLVTEFNGHMFPTKPCDDEEHRLIHALRHACVLEAAYAQEKLAGAFGWCMFDYNTHKDFGSGDKICYHGVFDMFRNPKLAAAVYASQNDHTGICEISSSMDIGDHPAGNLGAVYAFSNADNIRLYKNDVLIKEFYPNKEKYPHLPHPPFLIDDFIGELLEKNEHFSHKSAEVMKEILSAVQKYGPNHLPLKYKLKMALLMLKEHLTMQDGVRMYYQYIGGWGGSATTFCFEAVKDGKIIRTHHKKAGSPPQIYAVTKSTELHEEETYDVAEVRITAVDEYGNRLPYYQEPVTLETWGVIELIGPKTVSLKGGAAGTYVKTKGIRGEGNLKIFQEDLGEIVITFTVV